MSRRLCFVKHLSKGELERTCKAEKDSRVKERLLAMHALNLIEMFEPKVKKPEERYFVPCTMDFIRRYTQDFDIVGKLFSDGITAKAIGVF